MIIITILVLPLIIKLFTNFCMVKLKTMPRTCLDAQTVVEQINKKKLRPLKVEKQYSYTYCNFHDKLKNGEINRKQILAIRSYLEASVNKYEHKKFKNDAHAIYTMLKAKDITVRELKTVDFLVA